MSIVFLPKLVRRSALMSPLSVPNVIPIRTRIRVLWRILRSVRNEGKKIEEIKTKYCSLVSRNRKWLERFSSNLVCGLPLLAGISLANLVPIGLGITQLHRCENCVFFLPVNTDDTVLTVWRAGFLGRTTHYRVS